MTVPVRKASIGIAAAAALLAFPAASQQVADAQSPYGGSPACAHLDNKTDAGLCCDLRELDKSIEAAKQRGSEADRRAAAAQQKIEETRVRSECNEFLKAGRDAGQFTREKVVELAGGKVTSENICDIARKLGHIGPKSSAPSHTVR